MRATAAPASASITPGLRRTSVVGTAPSLSGRVDAPRDPQQGPVLAELDLELAQRRARRQPLEQPDRQPRAAAGLLLDVLLDRQPAVLLHALDRDRLAPLVLEHR